MQSSKPGTAMLEDANKLGCKIIMEFTRGEHQFIVAIYINKYYIRDVHPDRAMRRAIQGIVP